MGRAGTFGGTKLAVLLVAMATPVLGQISITSIQSSELFFPARDVQGITAGTFLYLHGFVMYLNGNFVSAVSPTVLWTDAPGGNVNYNLQVMSQTTSQIQVFVPEALYSFATQTARAATVTITQGPFSANGQFFVNPPMALATSFPVATTGVPYSTPILTGGTPPYIFNQPLGSVPGLVIGTGPQNQFLAGTPTTPGIFSFFPLPLDQWNNTLDFQVTMQVVSPAIVSNIVPNTAPAGTGLINMVINGSNFVDDSSSFGGSKVEFVVNGSPTQITSQFVSTNQLIATIPTVLMSSNLVTTSIVIRQPDNSRTTPTPFTILGPVITSLSPSQILPNSGPLALTINGANFSTRVGASDVSIGPFEPQVVFGNTTLQGTYVNPGVVTVTVPANLVSTRQRASVIVVNPGGSVSAPASLIVNDLAISTASLPAGTSGTPYSFPMTVTGGLPSLQWSATGLPAGLSINQTTGVIAGTPQTPGTFPVVVRVSDSTQLQVSANYSLAISTGTLRITTTGLPSGTTGTSYNFRVTGQGGATPYQWSATGLPAGLSINPQTGDITGIPQASGTFPTTIRLIDSAQAAVSAVFSVSIAAPPPVISTPNNLPTGTVGVSYAANLDVSRGGPFTFSLSSGRLPDGLTLSQSGSISGVPTRAGTFDFLVVASDDQGNTPNKGFTIVIRPAPLSIPDPTTTLTVGTAATITLSATGGVPPTRIALSCTLPAGLTFDGTSTISGTPTTPGSASCKATATDSSGTTATRDFTITVVVPTITLTGGTLPGAQVGVTYNTTLVARGGLPPFTYTGSGLPDGLSLSTGGVISGTPTTPGPFSFAVTATDSNRSTSTATFSLTVVPAALSINTTSLANGAIGTPYSATLAGAGGVPPFTWSVTGLPSGISATPAGVLSGTPDTPGSFTVTITVTDSKQGTATARLPLVIAAAPVVITTASAPGGTVGVAYSAGFAASGGLPPFSWTATGLPAGLSISSVGTISGQPTAPGTFNVSVTARDSAGSTSSKSFSIVVTLPTAPPFTFSGVGGTSPPLQQPRLGVTLGSPYPVDVIVTLTLTFAPDSGADDPSIQFSSGGRTARITIPAGSTSGSTDVGVQTGTVAGVITVTSTLQASGSDVTPSPAPRQVIRINAAAPVLTQVTAVRTATGFTVTITGFVTSREMTQAVFQFNPTPGTNLQTTGLTVTVDAVFASYFGSAAASPFGGQFTFTQPFTVNGNLQGIASVTVTLANRVGTSAPGTATLN